MGFIPRLARSFSLILLAAGGAAQAEVMHMPFDCRFDGARVHLRPSPERTYAIIGRHEHEIFTACSPTEPGTCRNWIVHRFDFDCQGARVAWLDAAVAASRITDWDAWAGNGRFQMRMNPLWGVARARQLAPRQRWMRRHFMQREDGFADGAGGYGPRVVTVPPGFAPSVGIPLSFSGGAPDVAEVPGPSMQTEPAAGNEARDLAERSSPPPREGPAVAAYTAQPVRPLMPELPVRAPSKEERRAAASAPPIVAPAPQPATKDAVTAAVRPAAAAAAQPPSQTTPGNAASSPAKTATKTQGFTIINGPHAAKAEPPAPTPPVTETATATSSVSAPIETGAVAPTAPDHAEAPPPDTDATSVADATPPPSVSTAPTSEAAPQPRLALSELSQETIIAAGATTLALTGLAVFGVRRWRRRPSEAPPVNRDIADISFDGGRSGPMLALERAPSAQDFPDPPSLDSGVSDEAGTNALPMPTSYAEALEILGASSDASTGAIKKIVDGLRQSWHPDLARSESDRLRREARVRQINVAWDLVAEQRRNAA